MPKARGLRHIHFLVRDLDGALRFYREVFGLTEAYRDEENGEVLVFLGTPDGDVITIHGSASDRAGNGGGIAHFGFTLADPATLDEALRAVEACGGKFLGYAEWEETKTVAYVRDPEGYVIEIDARPEQ